MTRSVPSFFANGLSDARWFVHRDMRALNEARRAGDTYAAAQAQARLRSSFAAARLTADSCRIAKGLRRKWEHLA